MQDLADICRTDVRAAIHTALEEMVHAVSDCKHTLEAAASKLNDALADATMKFDLAVELRMAAFRGEVIQGKSEEGDKKPPEKPAEDDKQKLGNRGFLAPGNDSGDKKSTLGEPEQSTNGDEKWPMRSSSQ